MKTKYILALFTLLLSLNSYAIYRGDLCDFNGIVTNSKIDKQREFAMMFEDINLPNFREIFKAVAALTTISPEVLNDKACPVYNYARSLLTYYNNNKEKLDGERPNIKKLIEIIQDKLETESK